jgi:hypothetical protein
MPGFSQITSSTIAATAPLPPKPPLRRSEEKTAMNAYRDYIVYAGDVRARPTARRVGVKRFVAWLGRHFHEARLRRDFRDLDHLDDWILKDVGLFRERLPGGASRIRRR